MHTVSSNISLNFLSHTAELRRVNTLLERERHDAILSRTALQEKSKQFIEEQQIQINQLIHEKVGTSSKF